MQKGNLGAVSACAGIAGKHLYLIGLYMFKRTFYFLDLESDMMHGLIVLVNEAGNGSVRLRRLQQFNSNSPFCVSAYISSSIIISILQS